ncbi:hypothetical protein LY78DRAFT_141763 [Colletotrichum sublineola]|nr:hypothetical protein LY78DRAFT_141763 [Colletotrichum sublineola]
MPSPPFSSAAAYLACLAKLRKRASQLAGLRATHFPYVRSVSSSVLLGYSWVQLWLGPGRDVSTPFSLLCVCVCVCVCVCARGWFPPCRFAHRRRRSIAEITTLAREICI